MAAADIADAKGGESFRLDYAHLDVAQTISLGNGSWGMYSTTGGVQVATATVKPSLQTDDTTSAPGTFTVSVLLSHLPAFVSAHVHYEGNGFTLSYSTDSSTWTNLSEDGVIPLTSSNKYFDLKVIFAGGVANDPAELDSLTVYVLATENIESDDKMRTLTLHDDPITSNGLTIGSTAATVSAATAPTPNLPPGMTADTTSGTAPSLNVGTIEAFMVNGAIAGVTGTLYVDGASAASIPQDGKSHHCVLVLGTPANTSFTVSGTLTHLATYTQTMSADDVLNLYIAQTDGHSLVVNDSSAITLTESSPATDIYAYAWAIVSGTQS